MTTEQLIREWFRLWQMGDYLNLPISDSFKHSSPFGTIEGKQVYLDLVARNKDKFLSQQFLIHEQIVDGNRACVRYTATQGDFKLDVSEWYLMEQGQIQEIIAYYHIGDIREDRQLD